MNNEMQNMQNQNNTTAEEFGYLVVNVRTARGAFPVEGAIVTVSDTDIGENNTGVISSMVTDSSGSTIKIPLSAPSLSRSLVPGDEKPYSVYNISTTAEGFYSVENINVPIFSGITSIQPVELIPVSEYGGISSDYPKEGRRFIETPRENNLL